MPAIYGIAAAMFVLATGIDMPTPLLRPITMLSDAALPLMILVLGMQLERAVKPSRPALVAAAVCVSLLVAPLVALGLTSLLDVSGAARQAVVVLSSMPVAVATTILALEFDASPELRHERGVSVDGPQPDHADAAHCVSALKAATSTPTADRGPPLLRRLPDGADDQRR